MIQYIKKYVNNFSQCVLRLLKPILKRFYTSRTNFSKIACYSNRILRFRSHCPIFWLFRSKFHKEIAIFELKIHLTTNFNTQSRLHSQEKWKFLRYSSNLDQIHLVSTVFFMWNHDFRASSAERYVLICVIKISMHPQ